MDVIDVEAVDAAAQSLYGRAKVAGADFGEVTDILGDLITVIKRLRIEARDPEGSLSARRQGNHAHTGPLSSLLKNCGLTLQELYGIINNHEVQSAGGPISEMESRNFALSRVCAELAKQKAELHLFLGTMQSHKAKKFLRTPLPTQDHPPFIPATPSSCGRNLHPSLHADLDGCLSQKVSLISTKDIVLSDQQEAGILAPCMDDTYFSPQQMPPDALSPGTLPDSETCPSSSPYLVPRYPPTWNSSLNTSQRPVRAPQHSLTPCDSTVNAAAPPLARLGPDAQGKDIPADAMWTRIDRRLVSAEVLQRAGVRYEARPTFVAVLGILTSADILAYVQRSAEVRRARHVETLPQANRLPSAVIPEANLWDGEGDHLTSLHERQDLSPRRGMHFSRSASRRGSKERKEKHHEKRRSGTHEREFESNSKRRLLERAEGGTVSDGENVGHRHSEGRRGRERDTDYGHHDRRRGSLESREPRGRYAAKSSTKKDRKKDVVEALGVLGSVASLISLFKDAAAL